MEITQDQKDAFFANLLHRAICNCVALPPDLIQLQEEPNEEERSE